MSHNMITSTVRTCNTVPIYPQFTSQAPPATSSFKIYIGIDFGTDGTALSYAFNDEVFIHTEWSNKKYGIGKKTNTIILLDEDNETQSFGTDAKFCYLYAPKMKDKWMLFDRFKMSLFEQQPEQKQMQLSNINVKCPLSIENCAICGCKNTSYDDLKLNDEYDENKLNTQIEIKDKITAANGKKVKSSIVFIAAFKHIHELATTFLKKKKIKGIQSDEIQWIITVPAIWSDTSKLKMRDWAIKGGLVNKDIDNQCKIVYEPDCASLSLQYQIFKTKQHISNITDEGISDADVKTSSDNNNETLFNKGEKYVLIDAGGGTVDVACHQILGENGEFGIKEILAPSGGNWGSIYIDDAYMKLLQDIFTTEWMDEFKLLKPDIYIELIDNFQRVKKTFYSDLTTLNHHVELPVDFMGFMQDKLEDVDIEHFVSMSNVFGLSQLVSLSYERLEINVTIWKMMFDHVMEPIIKHTKKLLNEPKLMNCRYLALVGGLSCSNYFQFRMDTEFGIKSNYKLQLVNPKRPILSVVEGAAYFGITQNYIKARVLKYTYGQRISKKETGAKKHNVSLQHINKYRYWDKTYNENFVKYCFNVMARKNEEIYIGQIKKSTSHRRTNQSSTSARLLRSDMENPTVSFDGIEIGKIEHKWSDDPNDTAVTLEFHFYETVLKAVVYTDKFPNQKQTMYLVGYK